MPNSFGMVFVFSSHSSFSSLEVWVLCCYYCNPPQCYRAYVKARDNIPPTIEFLRLLHWPTAPFLHCPWNFCALSKGKDELICTDLKHDQNRGFPNPSFFILFFYFILFSNFFFFLSRVVRSILALWEGKIRASYFMPQRLHCLYEGFYSTLFWHYNL